MIDTSVLDSGSPSSSQVGAAIQNDAGVISSRSVVMRQFRYIEGMHVEATAAGFFDQLFALFPHGGLPPTDLAIDAVLARNAGVVQWMMAQSMTPLDGDLEAFTSAVRENTDWVGRLDYESGEALKNLWWAANSSFFSRLLMRRMKAALATEHLHASAVSLAG